MPQAFGQVAGDPLHETWGSAAELVFFFVLARFWPKTAWVDRRTRPGRQEQTGAPVTCYLLLVTCYLLQASKPACRPCRSQAQEQAQAQRVGATGGLLRMSASCARLSALSAMAEGSGVSRYHYRLQEEDNNSGLARERLKGQKRRCRDAAPAQARLSCRPCRF